MKNIDDIIPIIKPLPLFNNVAVEDLEEVLNFFDSYTKQYEKNSIIKQLWDSIDKAGIVLNGLVSIKFLSDYGNEHKISMLGQGSIFALSFACNKRLGGDTIEIVSDNDSEILFLKLSRLFDSDEKKSKALEQVSINLLRELAEKNVFLNKKIEILSHHKIRDRVIVYLKSVSKGKKTFKIPLNRETMALFLGVERSSLSRELSNMKKEGIIDYNANEFSLFL